MSRFDVVVIGDIHQQHGHRWNDARLAALRQAIAHGVGLEHLGAWVLLGDVFHQRSTPDDRNAIAPLVQEMADVAPVFIDYGNHDQPGDLQILTRLDSAFDIVVFDRPALVRLLTPNGQTLAVFGLPYPHKGGIVAAGHASSAVRDVAADALADIMTSASAQLRDAASRGEATLFAGHATIAGAVSSVGQPMGLERDIAIDVAHLEQLGTVPKVFGHIHKPQAMPAGAVYVGSVGRNDFGEVEDKRIVVVEYQQDGHRNWHGTIVEVPLACPRLWHVEGELTREAFTWRVTRGPDGEPLEAPASWNGDHVRVRYRFDANDRVALDKARILAEFADATLELDPVAVRTRAVRAPEVAAATTVDGKVAAFVRSMGREWTPSMAAKLAALQAPQGAAFLIGEAPAVMEVA